ncbi:MAG: DUF4827 domain-containing protein [Prevotella sp.]|jgi:hypothetical protein|nr:DUF4827 domain-containing protein [Prevotella sp.]
MKNFTSILCAIVLVTLLAACHDTETYADQKKRERTAIKAFIQEQGINVISESEFKRDSITDSSKKEFVLFENTGVYMQIVRKGCGKKIEQGETANVLCRFNEYNLLTDSLILSNNILAFSSIPDKMTVTNTLGTFTASFISGIMTSQYQTTAVPAGWLVPLSYVNVGRMVEEGDQLAKVRIIVPHSQGTSAALANVTPCYYEITYERGL